VSDEAAEIGSRSLFSEESKIMCDEIETFNHEFDSFTIASRQKPPKNEIATLRNTALIVWQDPSFFFYRPLLYYYNCI
jgi:hypothetical protein